MTQCISLHWFTTSVFHHCWDEDTTSAWRDNTVHFFVLIHDFCILLLLRWRHHFSLKRWCDVFLCIDSRLLCFTTVFVRISWFWWSALIVVQWEFGCFIYMERRKWWSAEKDVHEWYLLKTCTHQQILGWNCCCALSCTNGFLWQPIGVVTLCSLHDQNTVKALSIHLQNGFSRFCRCLSWGKLWKIPMEKTDSNPFPVCQWNHVFQSSKRWWEMGGIYDWNWGEGQKGKFFVFLMQCNWLATWFQITWFRIQLCGSFYCVFPSHRIAAVVCSFWMQRQGEH